MSSSISSASITSSTRRSSALNPDETDLWELCHYAGVTFDPHVFRILVDLLRMDVHPQAVLDVLKDITPHSKFSSKTVEKAKPPEAKQVKPTVSDTDVKSVKPKTSTVTSSKPSKTGKEAVSSKSSNKKENASLSPTGSTGTSVQSEKRAPNSARSSTTKVRSKPSSVKSAPSKSK